MKAARDLGLGSRKERTPFRATKDADGVYHGGTLYERSDRAMHVGNAERCFSLISSYQHPRNLTTPAASTKIGMGEEPCEHVLAREVIVGASTSILACNILSYCIVHYADDDAHRHRGP